jgi:Na+/melibiose symporter-like transporter
MVEGPLASLPLIGAIIWYGMYDLSKKRQQEIQRQLNEKYQIEALAS